MLRLTFAVILVAVVGLACSDRSDPVATEEPAGLEATTVLSACDGELASRIDQQIVLLFPKGKSLRQAAQSQFDNIVRKCPRAEAQAKAIELVGFTNTKWREGKLTPGTAEAAVAALLTMCWPTSGSRPISRRAPWGRQAWSP